MRSTGSGKVAAMLPAEAITAQVLVVPSTTAGACPRRLLPRGSWYRHCKSAFDWCCAATLLLLTAPLLLLAMALVKLTSRGPALYSQTRLGRFGKPFAIYKVRSMHAECESLTGACWSKPGDARVTAVGRWLRRTHIDELPQLWNVLRGEMSLIGPRPERPEFVPTLETAILFYRARLLVRPGITGFAQVQLPPDTDLDSVKIKTAYDLHYVQSLSLGIDLRIGWATALKMAGISFPALARWFCFPARITVEDAYRKLVEEAGSRTPTAAEFATVNHQATASILS